MARIPSLDKLSYAELVALRAEVDATMEERQAEERVALRERLADMAKEHGFELDEVIGRSAKRRGSVAVKYRDPDNPTNTWTGRGRMPRWMTAATKKRGVKKEDFLI